ncbi:MAG TPA: hypothetical protein VI136_11495 [Verrucomicrobiae bacterium]
MDAWLKANLPDPVSLDARSREPLQRLAAALGAKQVVYLDYFGGSVTRRARTMDVLTYQLAAPDVVTVWGTMEVYDATGAPTLVLDAGAQVKDRSEYTALAESAFGSVLAGLCARPLPPPISASAQGDVLLRGSPFAQLFAHDTSLAEARARQRLAQRSVAHWLGRSMNETTRLAPFEDGVIAWNPFRPVFGEDSTAALSVKRGGVLGVVFVDYPAGAARRSIVPLLGYDDEVMKQQPIGRAAAKRFQQKQDENISRFQVDFVRALTGEATRAGLTVKSLAAEAVYTTGALQEIAAPSLVERGKRNGCALVVAVSSVSHVQARGGPFVESSIRVVDVSLGRSSQFAPFAWESANKAANAVMQKLLRVASD